jgi:hypothetical protein
MAMYLFALGAIDPPGLNVPPSIAYLLAFVLLMAAAALASGMAGSLRLNHLFAMLVLLGFAGVGGWIALGEGARSCTTQIGVAASDSVGRSAGVSSSTCRVAFGAGAVLSLVMAGVAASLWWRGR